VGYEPRPVCAPRHGTPGLGAGELVPDTRAFGETTRALHEHIGMLWYRLRGWVR
jgi:hypothetical protein